MVRAPCCEKVGLKKGPWTTEEDYILTSYIQNYGHANWRALPKHAGLLRCGKSCRLRWINYLKPDIKRGNFTNEEEETIIKLHEMLGNRWSAIAAKLPGRTDNEIKNVWHTHLKKRLLKSTQPNNSVAKKVSKPKKIKRSDSSSSTLTHQSDPASVNNFPEMDTTSACTSLSDFSSASISKSEDIESIETIVPEIDESFWSEAAIDDDDDKGPITMPLNSWTISNELTPQYPIDLVETFQQSYGDCSDDGMDFWYDLFLRTGDSVELPEF